MKISIVCVGKIKEAFYRDALAEYEKRLSRYCRLEILEVADEKTPESTADPEGFFVKKREGERILARIREDGLVIALAIEGEAYSSVEFANKLASFGVAGVSHIYFVIGGSLGLSDEVLKRADLMVSFSKMTFPHQLMRVILLEQIYRSYRITNHEPYHK